MARTREEILVAYLTLLGNQPVHGKSHRYKVFENRKKPGSFYYVGKAGALRVGRNIESSASCTEHINIEGIRKWVETREANPEAHQTCVEASKDAGFVQWWSEKKGYGSEVTSDEAAYRILIQPDPTVVVSAYQDYKLEVLGDGASTNHNE